MTDEVELTAEQEQQAADDAFRAGFAEASGEPEPKEEVEVKGEAEPEAKAEAAEEAKEEASAEPPAFTTEQIQALLAKASEVDTLRSSLDKMSGHVGSLLQQVKELRTPPAKPEVELPPVDESEFAQAYPEFASYLKAQLQKTAPSQELVDRLAAAEQREAELAMKLEERTISLMMPDWAETVNSDGYKAWLLTQPQEVQQVAQTTTSAMDLGKVLSSYKQSAQKQQKAAQNKQRLEQAIPPSGITTQPKMEPTEEESFLQGWSSVRGRAV